MLNSYLLILSYLMGSFLNLVITRLPVILRQEWRHACMDCFDIKLPPVNLRRARNTFNLSFPASHCPQCRHRLSWHENIPLISFIWQHGRCRHCQQSIGQRYFVIEALTVLLSALIILQNADPLLTMMALLFTWNLISIGCIDFEHLLIPDTLTLLLFGLGLLSSSQALFVSAPAAILGGLLGYVCLGGTATLFQFITGKIGLGGGDSKLFAALGCWLGWERLALVLLLASTGALLHIFCLRLLKRKPPILIPFGPYLAASGWICFYGAF